MMGLVMALALQPVSYGQQAPLFRAETRLVVLYATVTNSSGEAVTSLDQGAFAIFENGKRQPIALFRRDDIPVSVGLLIDNSGSMRRLRPKVEAAALAFARASNPQDEIFVLNFADKPRVDVPLTSDIHRLEAAIARVDALGGTAMYDAIDMAEEYLRAHATRDRKVLLILTDGNDNASATSLDRVEKQAERSQVVIDAVGLFSENDAAQVSKGRHELDRLVARTGGLAYYPTSVDQIETVALDLAQRIRSQYMIAYAPLNQSLDGSYRTIRVSVTAPQKLTVHTRPGYRATAGN
jgi:Ca-activated chloride channel homolog